MIKHSICFKKEYSRNITLLITIKMNFKQKMGCSEAKEVRGKLTKEVNGASHCVIHTVSKTQNKKFSADFLIFRRISVTRQFLVLLTSIVGKKYTMEVNEIRNCLFTDILLAKYQKLAEYIQKR